MQPRFGLRPVDFGELAVTGVAAIVLLASIAAAYRRTRREATRYFMRVSVLLVVVLAFFGICVDMLHIMADSKALGIVEDFGEMLVGSAMVAFAVWHILRMGRLAL